MQHVSLPAAVIVLLFSSVTASAQQSGSLSVKDDAADPCRRFKLRILMPSSDLDARMEGNKPDASVDYKMRVTNPCVAQVPQVAVIVSEPLLPSGGGGEFFGQRQFKIEPAPGEPPSIAPQRARPPSALELMRGRKQ